LDVEKVEQRVWLRAMILYFMGRHEEALEDLNDLLEEKPYYNGFRYYLRALIHYENGRRDLAEQDLMMGVSNTWGRAGIFSYVLGRMAIDDGDKEAGIIYLQQALATLDWYFRPMFPRIEQELADLGAAPLPEESSVQIRATPMPTTEAIPRPTIPSTINSDGFPELRYIIPVDIAYGTGSIIREDSLYPYPTYHFRPHLPISIESIQSLTIHLEPVSADETESFELFLWNIAKGGWDMLKPGWGATIIEEPERYVGLNGETYLAIRRDYETEIHIRNVWLTIEVTETNDSQITLGLE
jgi:tetratricopeptide (TPR) repeat protein